MENDVEKIKPNFWRKIIGSVQGIKHYEVIVKDTVGKSILYLLLIALLLGGIGSIRGAIDTSNDISQFISIYNNKCPNFELKNGELSVDGNMPLTLSQDKSYYFVIDTTNTINPDVLNSYDKGLLVLKDKMIEKQSKVQTQVVDFKSFKGITVNKDIINKYLPLAKLIIPFIFIGNILWYFIGGLLSALILALFALILNSIFKTELKYGQLYSLSIYALTTPLIIDVLFKIFSVEHFSYYWLFYHLIAFGYICFALNNYKKSRKSTQLS